MREVADLASVTGEFPEADVGLAVNNVVVPEV